MSKEVKLSSGHEDRVLSVKKEGSSFKVKVESFWKGEESGELHFSNHNWFNSLEECERDMDLLSSELESLGFKKS